jgi:hypothetical protein
LKSTIKPDATDTYYKEITPKVLEDAKLKINLAVENAFTKG